VVKRVSASILLFSVNKSAVDYSIVFDKAL